MEAPGIYFVGLLAFGRTIPVDVDNLFVAAKKTRGRKTASTEGL